MSAAKTKLAADAAGSKSRYTHNDGGKSPSDMVENTRRFVDGKGNAVVLPPGTREHQMAPVRSAALIADWRRVGYREAIL